MESVRLRRVATITSPSVTRKFIAERSCPGWSVMEATSPIVSATERATSSTRTGAVNRAPRTTAA